MIQVLFCNNGYKKLNNVGMLLFFIFWECHVCLHVYELDNSRSCCSSRERSTSTTVQNKGLEGVPGAVHQLHVAIHQMGNGSTQAGSRWEVIANDAARELLVGYKRTNKMSFRNKFRKTTLPEKGWLIYFFRW